jgi:hypothetical protein
MNTIIEAAQIITQIMLHIVGVHMKSTEVDLGNNIVDKYQPNAPQYPRT